MTHDVFYAPPSRVTEREITLEGEELQHLAQVMRRKEGDAIRVVDGAGTVYEAVIQKVSRAAARCAITARQPGLGESIVALTLGAGLLKNPAKFDFLVEKATELGVRTISPGVPLSPSSVTGQLSISVPRRLFAQSQS